MAITRITKGVIKPNENYDTHNIVSTGIITSVGADINGDLDVDGHTNLDNVSISGVTTFGGRVNNLVLSELDVNGNADISGNLSVGGVLTYEDVTSIDSIGIITARNDIHVGAGVSAVGVGTFGSLDIGGDIDVDGHTNLDNVSVAGVTTHSDDVTFTTANGNNILFDKSANKLLFGNAVTAEFGLGGSDGLLSIKSDAGGNSYITEQGAGNLTIQTTGNGVFFQKAGTSEYLATMKTDAEVELYHNGNQKLETSSTGITVTGTVVATGADINGDIDVDGHTNLDNVSIAGVSTFSGNINVCLLYTSPSPRDNR